MTAQPSVLRDLVLSLSAPGHRDEPASDGFTAEDWAQIQTMVRHHRLGALLHSRISNRRSGVEMPKAFTDELAASFRKQTLRSLDLQYEIARIHRILDDEAITGVFLKGAFLAFHAYAHPAQRPLRDIDVLVPRARVIDAYEALMRAGYARHERYPGDATAAAAFLKHLPPLVSRTSGVCIEVHARLFDLPSGTDVSPMELAYDPETWRDLIFREVAGERIAYLSPTRQLLHLIVHAVIDHRLNCGPLVLMDIAHLLELSQIDWPQFWRLAETGGQLRGCWLLLSVAKHFDESLPIVPPTDPPPLPTDSMEVVTMLMLGDASSRAELRQHGDVLRTGSVIAGARFLLGKLFPTRTHLAAIYGESDSEIKIAVAYFAHWWRLTTVRLPQYLASRYDVPVQQGATASARLQQWLADDGRPAV